MKLSNKAYDILKYVSLIFLDAIGVAYNQLAEVWNLPFGDKIQTTCTILSVLIGTLIGISSYNYNKDQKVKVEKIKGGE